MEEILPENLHNTAIEVSVYFRECWGNQTRIDYGTGHETCFVAWLYCLSRIGFLKQEDHQAIVLRVFTRKEFFSFLSFFLLKLNLDILL